MHLSGDTCIYILHLKSKLDRLHNLDNLVLIFFIIYIFGSMMPPWSSTEKDSLQYLVSHYRLSYISFYVDNLPYFVAAAFSLVSDCEWFFYFIFCVFFFLCVCVCFVCFRLFFSLRVCWAQGWICVNIHSKGYQT